MTRAVLFVLLLLPALGGGASAQLARVTVGVEVGIAGAENQDVAPSLGLTLAAPLTERLRGSFTYAAWTGCDNNFGCDQPEAGYGNQAFSLLALYRALGTATSGASVGAGLGWYEKFRTDQGQSERFLQEALALAAEWRRAVAYNSSLYLAGGVSIPTQSVTPRWGHLRVGVDVAVF